jgi:hypothetical protein
LSRPKERFKRIDLPAIVDIKIQSHPFILRWSNQQVS